MIKIVTINTLDEIVELDYDYVLSLEEWDVVAKELGYTYSQNTKWYTKDDDTEMVLFEEIK